jgi:aminopeptidase
MPMRSAILDKLACLLVRYSTAVQPGDRVQVCCLIVLQKFLEALCRNVRLAGGLPLPGWQAESPDVLIYVATPDDDLTTTPKPRDEVLHRAQQGKLRWAATAYPYRAPTMANGLPREQYESIFLRGCYLDWPDAEAAWRAASSRQARLIDLLRSARELRFVTPAGTDLRVAVAGRTWINGDGHENMPDGEVYTGPIEDATEGVLCFDTHGIRGGRLTFRGGRVVEAFAQQGEKNLMDVISREEGASVLGEVGIGCNERITRMIGHPLFDEKIAGTFHVALGASFPATGGRNQSNVHWDLVCDLRNGGRIEADGRVINEGGTWLVTY